MRWQLSHNMFPTSLLVAVCLLAAAGCPSNSSSDGNGASTDGTHASDGDVGDGGDAADPNPGETSRQPSIVYGDPVKFDEPAGITYANGLLYIADTNNHEIRTIDLNNNHRTGTFVIEGLKPPSVPPEPLARSGSPQSTTTSNQDGTENGETPADEDPRTALPRPPTVAGDDDLDLLDPAFPFRGRIPWAEIEAQLPQEPEKWINTDRPLEVSDFKGKFVMLDFWTFCCINCIHILPELKKLERAYPNQLVVIGVHSAKFEAEKVTSNVEEAVLRYEIEHPVVNDIGSTVWEYLRVSSWPTVMVIDPEGNLVMVEKGEWKFEDMDRVFQTALPYYRDKGLLDETPIKFPLLRDKFEPKPLNFPGKVLADAEGDRLFIADSNNNRIVVSSLAGKLLDVIGTGAIGTDDGSFDQATFNKPQGMALRDQMLYVADTENHMLRKIDLATKTVVTIAGDGTQGRSAWPGMDQFHRFAAPPERYVANPKDFAINSPWALHIHGEDLFIAMAGPHQIWKMTLDETEIGPYAGNGREDIVDGPLLPEFPYEEGFSAFAQPSGLTSDGKWLYVADSEGSSVRAVPFDASAKVRTIVGTSNLPGGRLFIFAHRDGAGLLKTSVPEDEWRGGVRQTEGPALQHCLGVVHHDGVLYVADTYNNAIKRIDLDGAVCTTIAGDKPE